MGRYNFTSPGAAAGNAIEEFFIRQAMEERQAMLDAQAKQAQEATIRQRDADLDLRRQQESRIGQERADAAKALEEERMFRRASTVAETAVPGVLDPGTADLLRTQGFGSLVTQGQPTQGAAQFDETTINEVPAYDVIPGVLETKGGFRWQQARQQEEARKDTAAQAAAAAAERAAADRASRESMASEANATRAAIAAAAASGRNANADLDRQIKQLKIDSETTKQSEAQKAAQASAEGQKQLGLDILKEVDRLSTQTPDKKGYALSSGAQSVVGGMRVPGVIAGLGLPGMGTQADATAAIKALTSKLDVNLIRQMKSQSKTGATGFGALSERELNVLENAAAMLDTSQSEPQFLERLNDIRAAAQKLTQAGDGASSGSGRVYYDANGNPMQR